MYALMCAYIYAYLHIVVPSTAVRTTAPYIALFASSDGCIACPDSHPDLCSLHGLGAVGLSGLPPKEGYSVAWGVCDSQGASTDLGGTIPCPWGPLPYALPSYIYIYIQSTYPQYIYIYIYRLGVTCKLRDYTVHVIISLYI